VATKVLANDFLEDAFGLLQVAKTTAEVMEELRGSTDGLGL